MKAKIMVQKIIQIQKDIAGIITMPLFSKGSLNLIYLVVLSFGLTQVLLNIDFDASFYIAIIPAIILVSGVWLNFVNRVVR